MQTALAAGDRKLLMLAAVLIAALSVAALLIAPPSTKSPLGIASSYSTDSGGAKAAYLLLGEMGYPVERWTNSPEELPGLAAPGEPLDAAATSVAANTVLVLVDPIIPATAEEKLSLANFVRHGGRILTTGTMATVLLPETSLTPVRLSKIESKLYSAEIPGPLTRGAPAISMKAETRWSARAGESMRYYGDADGATVVRTTVGKGEVIWWADSGPLTNYGLTEASNLMLFLNSIGEPGEKRILWDEYFHGQRAGLWSYLGRTPVPGSMVQVAVLLLAALVTFGRRHGPLRRLREESRLSPLEFVETVGDLYQRKGGAAEALEIVYHRFRFLLSKRLGLPPTATLQDLQRGVRERLGWAVPGFFETLQRCDLEVKDRTLSGSRSLHLIQELHDYGRRFGLGKTGN